MPADRSIIIIGGGIAGLAEQALEQVERTWSRISGGVEVQDVATPPSYELYTGNWQGSSYGWLLTKKTMLNVITGMRKTLRGLANLTLARQWVDPGGSLPLCAASGQNAVRLICHAEGMPFRAVRAA